MDFEEMKVIWDSQNKEPLYAVDEAGLHASVRRKTRAFARRIFWRDVREISIGLASGAGFFVFGWTLIAWDEARWRSLLGPGAEVSRWDAVMMLAASALFLHYALYHFVGRKRQERRERQFESSLRGDIDRTLAQTEYQIRMAQGAVWWGLIPLAVATGLGLYVICTIVPTPLAVWLLIPVVMVPAFVLDIRCKRRPIRTELLPLKQEFESLRHKLTESDCPA
jgi:hypothetical protein